MRVTYRTNRREGRSAARNARWGQHGRYIARAEARPDPENKGLGFDQERADVHVPKTLSAWEKAGDERLYQLVVSPENGHRLDLQQHARDLMAVVEEDLETRLEWVAVEHDHNDHPHLHVAVRGRRDDGSALRIDDEYVKHGFRTRSRELATMALGERTRTDVERARKAGIEARYVGALDHEIEREAAASDRTLGFRRRPPPGTPREQVWQRLERLEGMGIAVREGSRKWRVPADFQQDLRALQHLGDIQRAMLSRTIDLTEPPKQVRLQELRAGEELTGRMAGTFFDERSDRVRLVIEGTDGQVHVVRQTPKLERQRARGNLEPGALVTLRGKTFARGGVERTYVAPERHAPLEALRQEARPTTPLDRDALRWVRNRGALPEAHEVRSSFAQAWSQEVRERRELLLRAGLLEQEERGEGRAVRLSKMGERMMERGHERTPVNLEELRRGSDKPVHAAAEQGGQRLVGTLEAVAYDQAGRAHAVLDTGRELTTVPTQQTDLEVGHEYEAQSRADRSVERRRIVSWQLDELERLREHDRGHER